MSERVYIVRWSELETWDVLKRTPKQLKLQRAESSWAYTRIARDLENYKATPGEAWAAEAARLTTRIDVCKAELQRLRSALGQAESHAYVRPFAESQA